MPNKTVPNKTDTRPPRTGAEEKATLLGFLVLVHMIEETGRHAGHADILREQIDGAIGR